MGTTRVTPDSAPTPDQALHLLGPLTAIVARAAAAIRGFPYATVAHRQKPDNTAVTAADEASDTAILDGLRQLAPLIPVVSEEQVPVPAAATAGRVFFCVDPLDGTREYLEGNDNYTVNLALIADGCPMLGIIAAPARNILWRGIAGRLAERLVLDDERAADATPIRTRAWPERGAVALVSRSHLDPATKRYLQDIPATTRVAYGSSIKFCMIAEGTADIYPRLGETSEWDVAAGHALILAAGGAMRSPSGAPLRYGDARNNFRVPGFIAWGDPARANSPNHAG